MSENSPTYKVHVTGAEIGMSFTLYLNNYPHPVVGGTASAKEFDFEVSSEFTGEGKIKVYGRLPSRTTQNIAYSIPVYFNGKDQSISFHRDVPKPKLTPQADPEPVIDPIATVSDDEKKTAVEQIQSVTKNELREKIQQKKTGNSFWDNLK